MLINEVYVLEQLKGHPLFPMCFDVFLEPGVKKGPAEFYLVFERLGPDLRSLMASAPHVGKTQFCATQLRVCCMELAQGLGHIHGLSILHADLKPANVLTHTGKDFWHIKIADFGCSCQVGFPGSSL